MPDRVSTHSTTGCGAASISMSVLGALLVILSAAGLGCGSHLMNVALRTPVSVRLETPVKMATEVTTRSPPDNQASPVVGRSIPLTVGPLSSIQVAHGASMVVSGDRAHVAVVDVDGVIVNRNMTGLGSMGENPIALFREKLDRIAKDDRVRAVILRINSPGGGVTASDIMRRDLVRFRQQTELPVVACVMDTGAGGAYYVATACDAIVAHPTSVIGGVGVILNLYNIEDTMAQFNILSNPIRSGPQIDAGSPTRSLREEEEAMLQEIADSFHLRFQSAIQDARGDYVGDPASDFNGTVFTAAKALEKGLIDQIGYLEDAASLATAYAGCDSPIELLLYRRENDRARSPYDVTPNTPLQNSILPFNLPGLDRTQMPTFLYLWQIEPTLEKSGG